MKIDQNQPGAWLGLGVVFLLVGLVVTAAAEDSGVGRFMVVVGLVLGAVGLLIFAVRAGTSRDRDGLG